MAVRAFVLVDGGGRVFDVCAFDRGILVDELVELCDRSFKASPLRFDAICY